MVLDLQPNHLLPFFIEARYRKDNKNYNYFHIINFRTRGFLAEGAKFFLTSLDVNFNELFTLDLEKDLCNFHYYQLINPSHPDYTKLTFHSPVCGRENCRYSSTTPPYLQIMLPNYALTIALNVSARVQNFFSPSEILCLFPLLIIMIRLDLAGAVVYDSLMVLGNGISHMNMTEALSISPENYVSCKDEQVRIILSTLIFGPLVIR